MFNRTNSLVLTLVLVITLGLASTAMAGKGLFIGANFPTGDFNSSAQTGWNLGGYFTSDLMPILELGGAVDYNDFSDAANAWDIHALGQLKILMFKGYLGLGVSNYKRDNDDRNTKFSWQAGLAAQIAIIEGRLGYHQIPGDGGSINWVSLSAGVSF
jgi:hypothetical protein